MTTVIQPDPAPVEMPASPWHAGERLLQEHVGVAARMAQIGPKVLRDYMPDQHRDFYAQLPLLLAGAVDPAGDPGPARWKASGLRLVARPQSAARGGHAGRR